MSRYIDAKWLQESLELADECKDCKRNVDKCVYTNIDVGVVCNAVDDAPSIDIVFCKDCRKTKDDFIKGDKLVWCGKWKTVMEVNEFCSRGERREP